MKTASAVGNGWLAASSQQCTRSCIMSCTEFYGKTSNHPGDSTPLQPRFGTLWRLAFPKTKITFEREEISDCRWDSGKHNGAADSGWENCGRRQGACFEETEASLSYVQWMILVSSSIDVSIFHIRWLDTFRTDLVHCYYTRMFSELFKIRTVSAAKCRYIQGNISFSQCKSVHPWGCTQST